MKKIECNDVDHTTSLPDEFWGKWIDTPSIHFPQTYLKINCHHLEKGARWMTREKAIEEAKRKAEENAKLLKKASLDFSFSFKK